MFMDEIAELFEQQIKDCCMWVTKLTTQKSRIIEARMASILAKADVSRESFILEALANYRHGDSARFDQYLSEGGYTFESLEVRAISLSTSLLEDIESLIARQHQNIRHLQKALENIQLSPILQKRAELQLLKLEQEVIESSRVTNLAIEQESSR